MCRFFKRCEITIREEDGAKSFYYKNEFAVSGTINNKIFEVTRTRRSQTMKNENLYMNQIYYKIVLDGFVDEIRSSGPDWISEYGIALWKKVHKFINENPQSPFVCGNVINTQGDIQYRWFRKK